MTQTELDTRIEEVDRWLLWYSWDVDTEWTAEDEKQYARYLLESVELDILKNGMGDYSPQDLDNYRSAAA